MTEMFDEINITFVYLNLRYAIDCGRRISHPYNILIREIFGLLVFSLRATLISYIEDNNSPSLFGNFLCKLGQYDLLRGAALLIGKFESITCFLHQIMPPKKKPRVEGALEGIFNNLSIYVQTRNFLLYGICL